MGFPAAAVVGGQPSVKEKSITPKPLTPDRVESHFLPVYQSVSAGTMAAATP
jgi:hypothetical protein